MSVDDRNTRVTNILENFFEVAINEQIVIDETDYSAGLDQLFNTSAWGFREILLVVLVAMELDEGFKASTGLYDCNPRAIYEGPIKDFLIKKNIPHRKSGPLNVAKAAVGLDANWAAQRRPANVAKQVVNLIEYIELPDENKKERIKNLAVSLLRRLIAQASHVEELAVTIDRNSDPDRLYDLCYRLTTETPDSGNTPQKISALLLKNYHKFVFSGINVTGGEDRASVTSTTSKKPGDINEEIAERILKVYEVTVKKFDIARIRDSYDCISTYNDNFGTDISEVIVICRPEDCPDQMEPRGLHGYLGRLIYKDMVYYYWDIFEWYANTLQRMTDEGRLGFYMNLNDYINEVNTSESVKKLWHTLHN